MIPIVIILLGVFVATLATASIRYIDQKVESRSYRRFWRMFPRLGSHFVYYQLNEKAVRKSLFWKCDIYHFLDHLWAWGMMLAGVGFVMLDPNVFTILFVLLFPVWRGWMLMFWLHVGLQPPENNEYHWTIKELFRYIVFFWEAP